MTAEDLDVEDVGVAVGARLGGIMLGCRLIAETVRIEGKERSKAGVGCVGFGCDGFGRRREALIKDLVVMSKMDLLR